MSSLPVSLYWMPEWWDRHYHASTPRPEARSQQALEALYLGRLRFFFEHFGRWGIGQEQPALGPGQIATVLRCGFELVPALLGTRLELADAWGFYPRRRGLAQLRDLKPVNVATHSEGEWILREKAHLDALYGRCSQNVDIGSVTNNAFRMLGEELYAGLLNDPAAVEALFETILQTMRMLYNFLAEHFGGLDPVPISNCNASLMGPLTYQRHVLRFDARQNRFAERRTGSAPRAAVHHCDVPVDSFLDAYVHLPAVASVQAAISSDIKAAKRRLPGCKFSALVSPGLIAGKPEQLAAILQKALKAGADDLALWNIDAATDLDQMRRVLEVIEAAGREAGRPAQFDALPLCWEEIEWAHARYRG